MSILCSTRGLSPRLFILTSVRAWTFGFRCSEAFFVLDESLILWVCVVAKPFLFIYIFSKFGLAIQPIILNHFKWVRSLVDYEIDRSECKGVMCSPDRYLSVPYFGIFSRFPPLAVRSYAIGWKSKKSSQNLTRLPLTESPDCYFANKKQFGKHNPSLFVSK